MECKLRKASLMLVFGIIFGITTTGYAQYFTRILDAGPIVTDSIKSAGGTWADINNDGYPEMLATGDSNLLYMNNGNGTFSSITNSPPLMTTVISILGIFGDYDNDGYIDLYQTNFIDLSNNSPTSNFLYRNSGPPNFTYTQVSLPEDTSNTPSASWIDYDRDGDLDIFAAGGLNTPDLFYKNNGDGTFTRIYNLVFLRNRPASGTQDVWVDYDNDGDMDLFLVNHSSKNELFKSFSIESGNPDSFVSITNSGLTDDNSEFDIGASWGDYDNDGDFDVIVAYSNGASDRLYQNNGDGTFTRILTGPVVQNNTSTSFIVWGDYDNDGDLDLFKATVGFNQSLSAAYRNDGAGVFTPLTSSDLGDLITQLPAPQSGYWCDYDSDGDLDMYILNYAIPNTMTGVPRPNYLLRNNQGNQSNWINIKCMGTISNRTAVGTKITIKATIKGNSVSQIRYVNGGTSSFHFQAEPRQHFGLGNATTVDSVIIEWTNGMREAFGSLEVNKFYIATEGMGISVGVAGNVSSVPESYNLYQNYPNPFNPSTNIRFSIPESGLVELKIFDVLGREISTPVNERLTSGTYDISFSGQGLSSGIYYYELKTKDFVKTMKMVLMK